MSGISTRISAVAVPLALVAMTACSTAPAPNAAKADFYWSAANETYAAGDYTKTIDHLERVLGDQNQYTVRAIPWYLVLTSGMAEGYMEIADQYAAGAHINKAHAPAFVAKASDYRAIASHLALRFAQNADKLQQIPLGMVPLSFPLPNGGASRPALLARIAAGVELTPKDAETVESLTLQHSVLMAACRITGAPDDLAKAEEILSDPRPRVTRATFGSAIAGMLDMEATLYSRTRLDEPQKLEAFRQRAEMTRKEAARLGSAHVVEAAASTPHHP